MSVRRFFRPQYVAYFQGAYFLVTGLWPIISISTFQDITGPKQDIWLVKTFGLLVASIGLAMILAARRRPDYRLLMIFGILSAAALAGADIWYAALRDVIRFTYLIDALIEIIIVAGWVASMYELRPRNYQASETQTK